MDRSKGQMKPSRSKPKADVAAILRKSWYRLRLSVRHPGRAPTWDAIVLTAASPEQAQLYDWQLARAKRIGRISPSTVTLAVPDPDGHRIGSGAATLNAIYALAMHYQNLGLDIDNQATAEQLVRFMASKHVLLLHAGGDSKRVPWANPMGKVFLPLPYLAADDPDGPVPLLFDHILAVASCARQALANQGGLFTMTGDVLPCFDASTIVLPEDAPSIITVPVTLDIAANHGVIVTSRNPTDSSVACLVDNLLQKPSIEELVKNQAILDDGRTLLDTGLIAVRGKAWTELVMLSYYCPPMIAELVKCRKEVSLYEDLVAAWVPAKHNWLRERPLGEELVSRLGKYHMFSYCADDLSFLHFGTSGEVLDHLSGFNSGIVGRRHLCSIPATTVSDLAASAVVVSSKIEPGVSIGEDSLIYDSYISSRIQIGSQCIVVSVNTPEDINTLSGELFRFMLPDRHCLWEVPLVGCTERVVVFCGLHDNPKITLPKGGTFCGKPWKRVLHNLCIDENDLWSPKVKQEKCLWNAKLFPVVSYFEMLNLATWLMGLQEDETTKDLLPVWKNSRRVSLEELHRSIDFLKMCEGSSNHQADLAAGIAKACINYGLLGRNLSQLCGEILQIDVSGVGICKGLLGQCPRLQKQNSKILPQSRMYQVQVDLLRACGDEEASGELEEKVWAAVADETALAVRYGFQEHGPEFPALPNSIIKTGCLDQTFEPRRIKVELPVRVDFVGGWSDTPPWSLERAGCVLNMAISLEGSLPIGTIVETRKEKGISISDDAGRNLEVNDDEIHSTFNEDDPFRLVKAALIVTGIIDDKKKKIVESCVWGGLCIRTWANVPRGSGLGTSSILAAAVVKALVQVMDGDASNENVARLVLLLEQIMGTGGGWQDQIGGLYPGIKCTYSYPGVPLRLEVIPVVVSPDLALQLQKRLLLVFTGQVRLAHQVLHKVVRRYLRRDNLLISSIKRLAEMAKIGREALMNGEIDEIGEIMMEAWRLHQELDPFCSNEFVDKLFGIADPYCCGYKLVGAGGGGFALFLAKDEGCAIQLRQLLVASQSDVTVYNWRLADK